MLLQVHDELVFDMKKSERRNPDENSKRKNGTNYNSRCSFSC